MLPDNPGTTAASSENRPASLQDEATVRELAADDRAGDMKGWLQRLHAWLFEGDIFAAVASDEALLRIHSTAEEFEGAAEDCFVVLQVVCNTHKSYSAGFCSTLHLCGCGDC